MGLSCYTTLFVFTLLLNLLVAWTVNGQNAELAVMKAHRDFRHLQTLRTLLLTDELQNDIEIFFARPVKFENLAIESSPSSPEWLTLLRNWLKSEAQLILTPLTSSCVNGFEILVESLVVGTNKTWAFKFLDASGKFGSGILEGNLQVLGSFAECLDISSDATSPFKSRYCTALLQISGASVLSIDSCVPAQCTTDDITTISKFLLNQTIARVKKKSLTSVNVVQVQCDSNLDEWHFNGPAVIAIVILSVFGFLLIAGTLVDASLGLLSSCRDTFAKHLEKTSLPIRALLCWSALRNGSKILSVATADNRAVCSGPPALHSIHGIRFVSMCWIILCHTLAFSVANLKDPVRFFNDGGQWWYQWIANATFSVDTFFFLSGLLLAYVVTAQEQHHRRINWIQYYLHRYWRLTPPYMLCLAIYAGLFRYLAWGPLWHPESWFPNQCASTWWTNLLYVNNFFRSTDGCMAWAWYLANDMQFYVISPLFIVPFFYRKTFGIAAWAVLMLAYVAATIATTVIYKFPAGLVGASLNRDDSQLYLDYYTKYYIKPWTRIGPYLVGVAFGYLLYQAKTKNWRLKTWQTAVGWLLALAASAAIIFSLIDENAGSGKTELVAATIYNVVSRPAWGVIVGFVILACETGDGGFVSTVLSFPGFIPLSRLSYCAYLVHPVIQVWVFGAMTSLINYSKLTMLIFAFGFIFAAFCVAFVVSLLFESPALGLERLLTSLVSGRRQPRTAPNIAENGARALPDEQVMTKQLENDDAGLSSTVRAGEVRRRSSAVPTDMSLNDDNRNS